HCGGRALPQAGWAGPPLKPMMASLPPWREPPLVSAVLYWRGGATPAGFAPGICAGFTIGAGAPGVGLVGCAPCVGATAVLWAALLWLLLASGLCAQAAPVIIATAKMPVVSFISDSYLRTLAAPVAGLVPGPAT